MADQSTLESNKSRLEAAYNVVKSGQDRAKALRTGYDNELSRVRHWEGDTFNSIVQAPGVDKLLKDWISKWGFSDDGSINGVMDRIDEEIGTIWSLLQSLFNQ